MVDRFKDADRDEFLRRQQELWDAIAAARLQIDQSRALLRATQKTMDIIKERDQQLAGRLNGSLL